MDAPFFLAIKLIIQDYCLNYNPVIYYTVFILPFFQTLALGKYVHFH